MLITIRWRIVIHGGIDGFGDYVLWNQPTNHYDSGRRVNEIL